MFRPLSMYQLVCLRVINTFLSKKVSPRISFPISRKELTSRSNCFELDRLFICYLITSSIRACENGCVQKAKSKNEAQTNVFLLYRNFFFTTERLLTLETRSYSAVSTCSIGAASASFRNNDKTTKKKEQQERRNAFKEIVLSLLVV